MIVIEIIGGLGNQMFQYAFGRAIQCRNNVIVKYDISGFDTYKIHNLGLDCFCLDYDIATDEEIREIKGKNVFYKHTKRLCDKISCLPNRSIIKEPFFNFNSELLSIAKKNSYIKGYWQSEKYFKDQEAIIRKDFTFKYELNIEMEMLSRKIMATNSISVHIRRGDYVTNSDANAQHGTCSLEYYYQAIRQIQKEVEDPQFFIFSDDIEWARQHLKIEQPLHFVEPFADKKNYDDLRLMSMCKHHIIANSTFSWWGAWLSGNQNKIVYAPQQWFKADNHDTKDLIPTSWRKK